MTETTDTGAQENPKVPVSADNTAVTTPSADNITVAAIVTEFLGTFALAGIVIKLAQLSTLGALGIAFGLSILVMVFGGISGAHFNPAITIALLINRKVSATRAIAYIIAQVLGGLAALALLYAMYKAGYDASIASALAAQGVSASQISAAGGATKYLTQIAAQSQTPTTVSALTHQLGISDFINVTIAKGSEWLTFGSEILGALIFGLGVGHAVYKEDKSSLETGLAVGFGLFMGLTIGGASVILNPAVAAAIGAFKFSIDTFAAPILVYVFGTIIGMTAGITIYRFLQENVLKAK